MYLKENWHEGRLFFKNNTKEFGHTQKAKEKMSLTKKGTKNISASKRLKGMVMCVDIEGNVLKVPKELFQESKELVALMSKEGRSRKAKKLH